MVINNGLGTVGETMKLLSNAEISDKAHHLWLTIKGGAKVSTIGKAIEFVGERIDEDSIGHLIRHGDRVRIVFQPPKDNNE